MINVYLMGSVGRKFNKKWELDVNSVGEAIRAININTKGEFCKYVGDKTKNRNYKIALQKKDNFLSENELVHPIGQNDIYIIPTLRGAGSGKGNIIKGAIIEIIGDIIIYAAIATGQLWAVPIGRAIALAGDAIIIGGVIQSLTPSVKQETPKEMQSSNVFNGNAATANQGSVIPVVYGRALVAPMPISITLENIDKYVAPITDPSVIEDYSAADGYIHQYGSF